MIKTLFGQAVTGDEPGDAAQVLARIRDPEINLVSALMPPAEATRAYLRHIDIEKNFIGAGIGQDSGYGRDVAFFGYERARL